MGAPFLRLRRGEREDRRKNAPQRNKNEGGKACNNGSRVSKLVFSHSRSPTQGNSLSAVAFTVKLATHVFCSGGQTETKEFYLLSLLSLFHVNEAEEEKKAQKKVCHGLSPTYLRLTSQITLPFFFHAVLLGKRTLCARVCLGFGYCREGSSCGAGGGRASYANDSLSVREERGGGGCSSSIAQAASPAEAAAATDP